MPYLRPVRYLLLNLHHGIKDTGLSVEDETVGIGNVLQCLVVDTVVLAHGEVHTAIFRTLGADDIGWHVLGEGSAGLDHRSLSHACLGILNDAGREDDTVLNLAVTDNLRAVAEDTTVSHMCVMRDV